MITVRPAPPEHIRWLTARARLDPNPGLMALEAVRGDRIVGMVGFDGWTATSVAMHVALDEPIATRRLLKPSFGLVFYEYGKSVAIAKVLSTNKRSLDFTRALGFREVFRGKDYIDHGVDLVIHEMRRHECRWLEN